MGIVKKQGLQVILIKYISLPLGILASIFIYPYNIETNDAYGYYNYIIAFCTVLYPFLFLGIPNLIIKSFPEFKDNRNGHNGILTALGAFSTIAFLISSFILYGIIEFFLPKNTFTLFDGVSWLQILLLTFLFGLIAFTQYYISNFKRIVIPNVLETLRNRIFVPVSILIIGLGYFKQENFIWLIIIAFAAHLFFLILHLKAIRELHISKVNWRIVKKERKQMINFSLFALIGTLGSTLSNQIDSVMITELVDVRSNGIYSIGRNLSNVISIPMVAVYAILAPIVLSLINEKKYSELKEIYKSSSNTLLTVTIFVFLGISVILTDVLQFISNKDIDYTQLNWVVFLLGASIIFNSATSINSHIILYSKYYRFNVVLILILGVSNIGLNYLFITVLDKGIIGGAIASFISLLLFDSIKFIYVWIKFKMQPFNKNSVYISLLGGFLFLAFLFIQLPFHPIVNALLNETIVITLFLGIIWKFKLSAEVNDYINKGITLLKTFGKK